MNTYKKQLLIANTLYSYICHSEDHHEKDDRNCTMDVYDADSELTATGKLKKTDEVPISTSVKLPHLQQLIDELHKGTSTVPEIIMRINKKEESTILEYLFEYTPIRWREGPVYDYSSKEDTLLVLKFSTTCRNLVLIRTGRTYTISTDDIIYDVTLDMNSEGVPHSVVTPIETASIETEFTAVVYPTKSIKQSTKTEKKMFTGKKMTLVERAIEANKTAVKEAARDG